MVFGEDTIVPSEECFSIYANIRISQWGCWSHYFFDLGNDYNHDGGAGNSDNQMFLSDINQPVCCEDDGIKNSHKMAGRK